MRTNTFTSLAGVALLALGALGSQALSLNDTRPCLIHPKQMVNVLEQDLNITIPPGGTEVIYVVPENQWLVLTDAWIGNAGPYLAELKDGALYRKGRPNPATSLAVNPSTGGGPVGWTFAPGSSVVFENATTTPAPVFAYALIGYLMK